MEQSSLEIICRNDVVVSVQLYDGDTGTTPLPLTGVEEINYYVRRRLNGPIFLEKTLEDGVQIVGDSEEDGQIELTFAAEDTASLAGRRTPAYFFHEFIVIDGLGNRTTVNQGRLTVRPTVAA